MKYISSPAHRNDSKPQVGCQQYLVFARNLKDIRHRLCILRQFPNFSLLDNLARLENIIWGTFVFMIMLICLKINNNHW